MATIERKHPRLAAEVGVVFHVGDQVSAGRTRNVSNGGLCADLDSALPIGNDTDVELTLVFDDNSKSETLRLPARVVWCTSVDDAYQVGIVFRALDKKKADYLRVFLKYLSEEKAPRAKRASNIDDRFS